jgi:TonB-linked SusC/RagA family outer membrane protein
MDFRALYMPPGLRLTKTVRIMKVTAFLLLACLQLSARGLSQTVTLSLKHVSLEQVFDQVKRQTGVSIIWEEHLLTGAHAVDIMVKNASVPDVLTVCLKGQSLTYQIIGNMVVITRSQGPAPTAGDTSRLPSSAVTTVHGTVHTETGQTLAGVNVMVKGSNIGTATDTGGNFTLSGIKDNSSLMISYTGYSSKQYKLHGEPFIRVVLSQHISELDNVQVIAYGTTTQRLTTGNITTVSEKEIAQQPVNNPLLALEGRVPGLFITQASGFSGSGITVQIRGQNSLTNGSDPFYVIDGVPYPSQLLPNQGGILGNSGMTSNTFINTFQTGNPLSFINPGDIESISILKDADATAIYGSRAANGAILITTKKGKAGATRVDINLQAGWQRPVNELSVLGTREYITMRKQAIQLDGLTIQPTDYDVNGFWDQGRTTNWQKMLNGNTGKYQNYNATLSGGTANTQFSAGATFNRQTAVIPGNFADQKGSMHLSIVNTSGDQRFHLNLTASYQQDDNHLPAFDLTSTATSLAPDAPVLYKSDGSLNWAMDANGNSSWTNPLAYLNNSYSTKVNNLIGNALLSYKIVKGLEVRSSFGYTNLHQNETVTYPLSATPPELRPVTQSSAGYTDNTISSWIIEPQLTYHLNMGRAKLETLIGSTINQVKSNGQILIGYGYNSDQLLGSPSSAASLTSGGTTNAVYKYAALFGRAGLNWDNRYLVNMNIRRDGSSRFGRNSAFHDFGSLGAGWIFSNEPFMKGSLPFISFGKLRVSYGTTGNDQIGDYQYLNLYGPSTVGIPYQGAVGLYPSSLTNPYLQWEETKKSEAGLDLGFLKDRLLLNVSYYRNRSSNQLLEYQLPVITGFTSITENFPARIGNRGWEFTLNTVNIKSRSFGWSTSVNMSVPKNVLTAFPNQANSSYASVFFVGQSIHVQRLYEFAGVDPATGKYLFKGSQGATSTPSSKTDRTVLINPGSRFFGGFQNELRYESFSLNVLFQFVKQVGKSNIFGNNPGTFSGPYNYGNQPATILNAWSKPGDISAIQRYSSDYSYETQNSRANFSNASYSDASFIRLKNISLSWQLPDGLRKKLHMQLVRIYLQGQNLLTITHYKGLDPETLSSATSPPLKVLTFGIQAGF